MRKVLIKYRAQATDHQFMPLFLYDEELDVINSSKDKIIIRYKNSEFYTFEFLKKDIEKIIA